MLVEGTHWMGVNERYATDLIVFANHRLYVNMSALFDYSAFVRLCKGAMLDKFERVDKTLMTALRIIDKEHPPKSTSFWHKISDAMSSFSFAYFCWMIVAIVKVIKFFVPRAIEATIHPEKGILLFLVFLEYFCKKCFSFGYFNLFVLCNY